VRSLLAATILLLLVAPTHAQLRPFGDVYALTGARIEVGDGRVIEKGDILIRDGLIEAVGPSLKLPPDAEVIKADGLVIFPGFIDACFTKGLKLPATVDEQDTPPDRAVEASPSMREANRKGIRADIHADAWLALTDADLNPLRKGGFTTALVSPAGALVSGYAALVNLSGRPKREAVVLADAAVCLALKLWGGNPFGGGGGYPGTPLGYIAQLRQTFYDAGYYARLKEAFERGGARRPPADSVLTSLRPVLDGSVKAVLEAETENDVVRALDFAEEFHLKPVLCGGLEAWRHAGRIAKAGVPVIVGLKLPEEPKTAKSAEAKPANTGDKPSEPKPEKPAEVKPPDAAAKPDKPDEKKEEKEDPDADVPEAARVERHRLWEEKLSNAKRLNEAGVTLALTTRGCKDQKEFWDNLRKAMKDGLPREAALKALSLNPARILGVERLLGTVEAGKVANLTVLSADFVDPKAEARYLFIDGLKFDLKLEKPAPRPAGSFGPGDGGSHEEGRSR
jgi:hypothetical protein